MTTRHSLLALAWLLLSGVALVGYAAADEHFGAIVHGVLIRADSEPVPSGDKAAMGVVTTEIRNDLESALSEASLAAPPAIERAPAEGDTAAGEIGAGEIGAGEIGARPLPDGVVQVPCIDRLFWPGGEIAGQTTRAVQTRLLRTREDVPETIDARVRQLVRRDDGRAGAALSPHFSLRLHDMPVVQPLDARHIPAEAAAPVFLVYVDHGGIEGGARALEVAPNGAALAARRVHGEATEDDPAGCWGDRLPADEMLALTDAIRDARAWELADRKMRTLVPDEAWVELTIVSGNAALNVAFPADDVRESERWKGLRDHLHALHGRIVARAAHSPR